MTATILGYIGFVVAALILAWAVLEIGKRLSSFQHGEEAPREPADRWIRMDPAHLKRLEEIAPEPAFEDEDEGAPQQDPQSRSQLNGHYSNKSKQTNF
jgi:hypothetical protein